MKLKLNMKTVKLRIVKKNGLEPLTFRPLSATNALATELLPRTLVFPSSQSFNETYTLGLQSVLAIHFVLNTITGSTSGGLLPVYYLSILDQGIMWKRQDSNL